MRIDDIINASYILLENENSESIERRFNQLPHINEFKSSSDSFTDPIPELFCDVYLKLLQHENLCITTDILSISLDDILKKLPGNQRFKKMKVDNPILKKNAHDYLKKNRLSLAKIVFESDNVGSNELKKYDKAVDIIDEIIAVLTRNTRLRYNKRISEQLLITAIQCYIFIDNAQKIENSFYHYKTSDKKSLYNEMSLGTDALDKNQLAIVTLIYDTYYVKCGKTAIASLHKFHNYADKTINLMLSCSNTHHMLCTLANALPYLNGFLVKPDRIAEIIEYINSQLVFQYTVNVKEDLLNRFIAIVDTGKIVLGLMDQINQAIYKSKSSDTIELSIFDDVLNIKCYYGFKMEICSECKQVKFTDVIFERITYPVC